MKRLMIGTLAVLPWVVTSSVAAEAVAPPAPIPVLSIAAPGYYGGYSTLSNYVQQAGVQKHLGLSAGEIDQIRQLIQMPVYQATNGRPQLGRPISKPYRRPDPKKIDEGIRDVLGKERFKRLEQIALQLTTPNKQQLFQKVAYRRNNRQNQAGVELLTKDEIAKIDKVQTDYQKDQQKLSSERSKAYRDPEFRKNPEKQRKVLQEWSQKYQKLHQDYLQKQKAAITDATWKRFQTLAGEKFGDAQFNRTMELKIGGFGGGGGFMPVPAVAGAARIIVKAGAGPAKVKIVAGKVAAKIKADDKAKKEAEEKEKAGK